VRPENIFSAPDPSIDRAVVGIRKSIAEHAHKAVVMFTLDDHHTEWRCTVCDAVVASAGIDRVADEA
jgi:hypothetical protein